MKAPFARPGGKSRLAKKIITLFPDNYTTYVEPFVGAGNILFKIENHANVKEVINDLDKGIFNIFKCLKASPNYINDNLNRKFLTREQFAKLKDKNDCLSTLQKIANSFAGKINSYRGEKYPREINNDFAPYYDRLKKVTIKNQDFSKIIKEYDTPKTFFYLDPPYDTEYKTYLHHDKDIVEQVYDAVKDIKGKFLLSFNNNPEIIKTFKDFNIKRVKTSYTLGLKNTGKKDSITELLISNY